MAIVTLITGANAGIGFELAAQLLAKGNYHVLLGCRSAEKGQAALEHLKSRNLPGSVAFTQLDVTDDDSINAAAARVEKEHGRLDVLVNNAAVGLVGVEPLRRQMREAFDTNATGPAVMGYAFAELLKKGEEGKKRIVNISSGAGSLARMFDPDRPGGIHYARTIHYQASKAAQNMVSAQQAVDFAPHGVKVLCWNPGFTVSNLGPFNTAENGARPTEEAVRPLVEIIEGKRDDEAHVFLSEDGKSYPW
ncbi:hypothetical protein LTR56_010719 [Elasticomyces elasticus]|nr:hypothetical protein LTR56_010719 [Elasticomyces elasticus]KAK3655347.1 hypothetical protein LTR22_010232 [Elasticomyces elasticus]KAK4922081.1 hypothetical protein LTR49_010492 [Elasticomyces elasticus]KAK5750984.1 hypothetical protein LTS12_018974 [Elasticomyces elasticus]